MSFCFGFRCPKGAPPFGIAMLGGSTRKGYATSVRRQSRQRLCGEFRLRQNARTAHWRRRPESRSGGSSIPFRDFKISILTVPSSSSQASYRLLRLFSFPHRSHIHWVAMCVRRYAAVFSYRKEISILTVLSKWRLHEASPADWGCRPLPPHDGPACPFSKQVVINQTPSVFPNSKHSLWAGSSDDNAVLRDRKISTNV